MLLPVAVRAAAIAAMAAVAAYHLLRLRARWRVPGDVALDLTHLAMAAAMVAMLTGRTGARAGMWEALAFALPAGWLVVRAVRTYVLDGVVGSLAAQAAGCCGMVGMLALSVAAPTSMAGMAMTSRPAGPAVLLLVPMAALTVATAAALRRRTGPELLARGCHVLMAGTTTLMAAALL
ncbi:MAG TPA: DUF5134 domain-containing protein [Jatrophihabitans sp.]|nr:DUF5134 domain-containing protein [Jatrophihabitans sp.]